MAAESYFHGPNLENEASDIGKVWDQVLLDYKQRWKIDLSPAHRGAWNMGTIEAETQQHLSRFTQWRHDDKVVDKLRHYIARNTAVIKQVAANVCNATSTAFPPTAAILTAFNFCLDASKVVSDDYDTIVSFFDIMNSFLERMSLLEQRLPPNRAYQHFVIKVFSALLEICAIAKNYREQSHGRLRKWFKAMIEGNDAKLKAQFDKMKTSIEELESATLNMTLRIVTDSGRKLDTMDNKLNNLQDGQRDLITMAKDQTMTLSSVRTLTMEANNSSGQILSISQRMFLMVEGLKQKMEAGSSQQTDSGAQKSTALVRVKQELGYRVDMETVFEDYINAYVSDTFGWITEEPGYKQISAEEASVWHITGPSGIGKSTLMSKIFQSLANDFSGESSTSVAYFFFRNDLPDHASIINMICWCVCQAVEKDDKYCGAVLSDLQSRGYFYDSEPGRYVQKLVDRLFLEKFSKDSKRRFILILDGVDQVENVESQKQLGVLMQQIIESESRIQIVCTSGHQDSLLTVASAKLQQMEITKAKLRSDMRKVARAQMKRFPRLRSLESKAKTIILFDIVKKADGMAYIRHSLRHLEQIGRKSLILKELSQLPGSTTELYERFLKECTKERPESQMKALMKMFSWLAYAKTLISLSMLNKLFEQDGEESRLDIDDELQYRLAKILRTYSQRNPFDREQESGNEGDSSENESEEWDHEGRQNQTEIEEADADWKIIIDFHDQSQKLFFQQCDIYGQKQPTYRSKANLIIFKDILGILMSPASTNKTIATSKSEAYAAKHWIEHLQSINRNDLSTDETTFVVQGLSNILHNQGCALRKYQDTFWHNIGSQGLGMDEVGIFGDTTEQVDKCLDTITVWAQHATALSETLLPAKVRDTMTAIVRDRRETFRLEARAHVMNWFTSGELGSDASTSFALAHRALRQCGDLLEDSSELQEYFLNFTANEKYAFKPPAQGVWIISNVFHDIPKDTTALRSIATALVDFGYIDAGMDLFRSCINETSDNRALFQLHSKISLCQFQSGYDFNFQPEPEDCKIREAVPKKTRTEEAVAHINMAISMKPTDLNPNQAGLHILVNLISNNYLRRVCALIELDAESDILRSSMMEYVDQMDEYRRKKISPIGVRLTTILTALAAKEQWAQVMELAKMASVDDRTRYVSYASHAQILDRAAIVTGQVAALLNVYDEAEKALLSHTTSLPQTSLPTFHLKLLFRNARFHVTALGTPSAVNTAKTLLRDVLARSQDERWGDTVSEASQLLANIIFEEFRTSCDAKVKIKAFDELKILVDNMTTMYGASYDPSQSQLIIPLALVTQRMGPVAEYADILAAIFMGCMAALQDDSSWNDKETFRLLSKVLMCMGGDAMEKEAEIAASCQLYIVDMAKWKGDHDVYDYERERAARRKMKAKEGDIDPYAGVMCNGCYKTVSCWKDGAVYLCTYCTNIDLCEQCFEKRSLVIKGEAKDWRKLCPEGHKHVKAPCADWRGVSNGILRMGRDLEFKDWLSRLQKEWDAAWVEFWKKETV